MKILFLAANPVDVVTRLRIDQEFREISKKIRLCPLRDHLELVSEWAVRAGDLQEALLRHQPDIVHFSGHCSQSSGIILEDEAGNRKVVNKKALSDLFRILKDNIRVVVFNSCYAKEQAQALTATIDFTIGMNAAIDDKAAILFASHFYQSLAYGRSVREAFELAVNQLELEDINVAPVPELLERAGANAARTRIVKPPRRSVEPKSEPAEFEEQTIVVAEDRARPTLIPVDKSNIATGGQAMRGVAGKEQELKLRPVVFLPCLFASIAISVLINVLRRFLSSDGDWLNIIALIVQSVFIVLAIIAAALTVTLLLRPTSQVVEKAASLSIFNGSHKGKRITLLTVIALIIAFGIWAVSAVVCSLL